MTEEEKDYEALQAAITRDEERHRSNKPATKSFIEIMFGGYPSSYISDPTHPQYRRAKLPSPNYDSSIDYLTGEPRKK